MVTVEDEMTERSEIGKTGENLAVEHLERLGWRIVDRNWRFGRVGEIDIVAVEPSGTGRGVLVFCEVKAKSGTRFGDPLEAITRAKVSRLHRLACAWMSTHHTSYDFVRIDAIGVLTQPDSEPVITHVKAVGV